MAIKCSGATDETVFFETDLGIAAIAGAAAIVITETLAIFLLKIKHKKQRIFSLDLQKI
jgi:hypothetical protein